MLAPVDEKFCAELVSDAPTGSIVMSGFFIFMCASFSGIRAPSNFTEKPLSSAMRVCAPFAERDMFALFST